METILPPAFSWLTPRSSQSEHWLRSSDSNLETGIALGGRPKHEALLKEELADPEDPEEYLAENVFWVPKEARWSHLQANAKQPSIGKLIDDAMHAIEAKNESLKGVLPKDYARPALDKIMLGELIDLISGIAMNEETDRSKDILGRVYEYFLGGFAGAEGKRGVA